MRTTLRLDDDIYESVMTLSRLSGESVGVVVSRLVRLGLNPGATATQGDFPTFSVPESTPMIAGDRAREFLDEDA